MAVGRTRSLSARRAWIEMDVKAATGLFTSVALRKESVDRNPPMCIIRQMLLTVALRKESVDRNTNALPETLNFTMSLSARRAWIEIEALHWHQLASTGRSPQGERG